MPWTIQATSVTGESHHANGNQCQDAHAWQEHNTTVLTVADGTGSAPHAGPAATIAATTITSLLATTTNNDQNPDELADAGKKALAATRNVIDALPSAYNSAGTPASINDFATTLLSATITSTHILIIQVGDGAIVTMDDQGTFSALTRQQEREYVNDVHCLTANDYENHATINVTPIDGITTVFLMTDGTECLGVQRSKNTPAPGFFQHILSLENNDDLRAFLTSPPVRERTDDDRTILIARKTP